MHQKHWESLSQVECWKGIIDSLQSIWKHLVKTFKLQPWLLPWGRGLATCCWSQLWPQKPQRKLAKEHPRWEQGREGPGIHPSQLPPPLLPASGWNGVETQLSFIQVSAWQAQEYGSGGCGSTLWRGVRKERSTPLSSGSQPWHLPHPLFCP